jgi:hypothetical protein
MTTTTRAYSSGHFQFNLDGTPTSAWIKSVDGGGVKAEVVTETVGVDDMSFRHTSTVAIEPINLQVAVSAAKPILQWIKDSWNHKFAQKDGSIVHGDFNLNGKLEQSFLRALITEVGFPALDGSAKEAAYLSVKLHPEFLEVKPNSEKLQAVDGVKAKMWLPSMFKLHIEGIDCTRVNKIDAITVKQKVTQLYFGSERHPELEPTGIEFPNITITLAAAFANDFIKWHNDFVVKGAKDPEQEKQGFIEFLDPQGNEAIFTINLNNVGIHNLQIDKSEANAEDIKRIKVELYVDSMDLEFGSGFE